MKAKRLRRILREEFGRELGSTIAEVPTTYFTVEIRTGRESPATLEFPVLVDGDPFVIDLPKYGYIVVPDETTVGRLLRVADPGDVS